MSQALTGQLRIIDSLDEAGGYPNPPSSRRSVTVPESGRRAWLEQLAKDVTE